MDLIAVGVNHRKAPIEIRERLAIPAPRLVAALEHLRTAFPVAEAVILSTCNRVEIYAVSNGRPLGVAEVQEFLARESGMSIDQIAEHLYAHTGPEAVRHLFRVTASLDSMVIGETQILGQVRDAYLAAKDANATSRLCNTLFQRALAVAKNIHSTTRLSHQSVSVPSVAVEFVLKLFRDLAHRMLLILGAGETARDTAARLREMGLGRVVVCNRSIENAAKVAEDLGGQAVPLDVLEDYLALADIVITCASAPKPLISREAMDRAMPIRENRPVFLMDLAVPRNVDPETNSIDNVYLYNVDDLQEVVLRNLDARKQEIPRCEQIIEEEVAAFVRTASLLDLSPAIQSLQEQWATFGKSELERSLSGLPNVDARAREELHRMVERLIARMLAQPITVVKQEMQDGAGNAILDAFKRLFRLQ